MKDHQIARLATKITENVKIYKDAQCLRTVIARLITEEVEEYKKFWAKSDRTLTFPTALQNNGILPDRVESGKYFS